MLLLLNLSDNHLKHARINTVVVRQKEMDRVGVEPTTSAQQLSSQLLFITYLNGQQLWKENLVKPHSLRLLFASSIAFYTIKQSFEEKSSQGNNKNKINTTKVWY
jgi:hypothetical protein